MTLNEIAQTVGSDAGFKFKSTTTGKEFMAVAKTVNGKFVISRPGKDAVVCGESDRYEMVPDRVTEIKLELKKIEDRRAEIVTEISTLETNGAALIAELDVFHNA